MALLWYVGGSALSSVGKSFQVLREAFQFFVFCCRATSRIMQLSRSGENLDREINECYDISCKSNCCEWVHDNKTFIPDSVLVKRFRGSDKELRSRDGECGNGLVKYFCLADAQTYSTPPNYAAWVRLS